MKYHIQRTPRFDRDVKKLIRRSPEIAQIIIKTNQILSVDPYNLTRSHNIAKLTDVKEGVYRIRFGDYRIRYDIKGDIVYLAKFRHRKDVYEYRITDK